MASLGSIVADMRAIASSREKLLFCNFRTHLPILSLTSRKDPIFGIRQTSVIEYELQAYLSTTDVMLWALVNDGTTGLPVDKQIPRFQHPWAQSISQCISFVTDFVCFQAQVRF